MIKGLLDVIEALLLTLLGLAVAIILGDTALGYLDARPENSIVAWFQRTAETLVPRPALGVFPDQRPWQTALLSVALWGLAAFFFVHLFRGLRLASDRLAPFLHEDESA
jgi:hypothetical protein